MNTLQQNQIKLLESLIERTNNDIKELQEHQKDIEEKIWSMRAIRRDFNTELQKLKIQTT